MSNRPATRLAWSLWVFSALFGATALVITFLGVSAGLSFLEFGAAVNAAAIAASFSTVGAMVASRRPKNPIGWIMCAIGMLFASNGLAGSYAAHALYSGSEPMPGAAFAAWANVWTSSIPLLPLLLLLFPDGRLPSQRWRPVVWLIIGSGLAEVVASAFAPGRFPGWPQARNPFGVAMLDPLLDLYVTYVQTPSSY